MVIANAGIVYLAWGLTREALGEKPFSLRNLLSGLPPLHILQLVPLFLVFLTLYSTLVFPEIPREFGGGKRAVVEVVLNDLSFLRWEETGLPVHNDEKRIGPVVLLLETGTMLVVKRMEVGEVASSKRPRPAPAIGLDKKLISVLIYICLLRDSGGYLPTVLDQAGPTPQQIRLPVEFVLLDLE